MPRDRRPLSEDYVKNRVIEWLGKQGYRILSVRTLSEHGIDIRAKRLTSNSYYIIEAKGDPLKNPEKMRYPFLVSGLGELVQRVAKMKYCRYALALPASYQTLVMRKIPQAVARRLDFEVLLVNGNGSLVRLTWRDFA